jgi:hypothetical protein
MYLGHCQIPLLLKPEDFGYWMQWEKMCLHALMLYHCFTFIGGCFYLTYYSTCLELIIIFVADLQIGWANQFIIIIIIIISAYAQGLSGAEAVWANRRYHWPF